MITENAAASPTFHVLDFKAHDATIESYDSNSHIGFDPDYECH